MRGKTDINKGKPTLFTSTLPKPHKPPLRPKLCQRACKADPKKNFKIYLSLSKKIKIPDTQANEKDKKVQY